MASSTGRSPYPSRRRRDTSVMDESNTTAGTITPLVGGGGGGGASFASTTSPYMMGQGLVAAKLSPTAMGASSTKHSAYQPRRFFQEAETKNNATPAVAAVVEQRNLSAEKANENIGNSTSTSDDPDRQLMDSSSLENHHNIVVDGIPITKLRRLAKQCLGTSPTMQCTTASSGMAIFYASLVYAKTVAEEDAFLYAQAMLADGQARRSVTLLEEAGLLTNPSNIRLEAVLLATQALSGLEDWDQVLQLLEDASTTSGGSDSWSPLLEDDDDLAWNALAGSIPKSYIHPLSRICLHRGHAYSETGHPLRAALFWKKALVLDPLCVEALDCLLTRSVVTSEQAYDIIVQLKFSDDMAFLKQLYLARVDLSPSTAAAAGITNAAASEEFYMQDAQHPTTPFGDASSIQLMSPSFQQHANTNHNMSNDGSLFFSDNPEIMNAAKTPQSVQKKQAQMQTTVDQAFDTVWNDYKLDKSSQVLAMAARRAYRRHDLPHALEYCQALAAIDPLCQTAGFVYISTLVAMGLKRQLFKLAHEWVDAAPKSARAWFAVGSYYYACERYHVAQRHFCRATRLDPQCTEAWIAFGCSFAACDESDQALASFRAAQRLAPGEHTPLLYIGMEYLRTNHLVLAQHFLVASLKASGGDPICSNELGVLAMQQQDYESAIGWFTKAIRASVGKSDDKDAIERCQDKYWEPTLFNLGQAYRKTRKLDEAIKCFERCISLNPVRVEQKSKTLTCYASDLYTTDSSPLFKSSTSG
jgi:tetratricopeptide (TPR) repeat protein